LRESVSVWFEEKRCNGYICQIDEAAIRFDEKEVDRYAGQFRDGCFVYQCERRKDTKRKF
jgi:hypothetical protein